MSNIIQVDGITYRVGTRHGGDVIEVYDVTNQQVASAERDHACESVYYDYYDVEGLIEGHGGSSFDLLLQPVEEVAAWLVATHPNN